MALAVKITATNVVNYVYGGLSWKSKPNLKAEMEGARLRLRRPQNVDGDFFVDQTCIDCDTCRWMAPQIFTRIDAKSAVFKQPTTSKERLMALQALLSCPTNSIRTEKPAPDVLQAQMTFPTPIDEQKIPGVYHCGYHSDKSYGASSFLIIHPEGNIMIDSPRYTEKLARNIKMLGGARSLFLTHKDDVADHAEWSKHFSLTRILHSGDVSLGTMGRFENRRSLVYVVEIPSLQKAEEKLCKVESSTADVEIKLEGSGPWSLNDDIQVIHTPGHTEGSVCLFYKSLGILFTGDHLAMTESGLSIYEKYNHCSVPMQLDSVRKLLELDFNWIIPGHGRRVEFKDYKEKNATLEAFVHAKYSKFS